MVVSDLERQIDQLRSSVVQMAERADTMMADALRALAEGDLAAADLVVDADPAIDRAYDRVQNGVLAIVALHGPVGRDLRLLASLIHVSLHVERMGDYAANVARTFRDAAGLPADPDITAQLVEMGSLAREVAREAMDAFVRLDGARARKVPELDEAVDRANVAIFHRLVRLAGEDERRLEWATRMIQVTRLLERFADHGVDIAEQAIFVATGESVDLDPGER